MCLAYVTSPVAGLRSRAADDAAHGLGHGVDTGLPASSCVDRVDQLSSCRLRCARVPTPYWSSMRPW